MRRLGCAPLLMISLAAAILLAASPLLRLTVAQKCGVAQSTLALR